MASPRQKTIEASRSFLRMGSLAIVGVFFYHAQVFLGLFDQPWVFRTLAVLFLLSAIPLPIIAVGNRKLFPELGRPGKTMVDLAAVLLFLHHFALTLVLVFFLGRGNLLA